MRVSDKARVRQRRIVHGVLILISFSLMFLGKADLAALRNLRMASNDFLAPIVDVVSAPIRGVETMVEGVRTVASLRAENVRPHIFGAQRCHCSHAFDHRFNTSDGRRNNINNRCEKIITCHTQVSQSSQVCLAKKHQGKTY